VNDPTSVISMTDAYRFRVDNHAPYIAAHAAKQGVYFAQNGYVFVAADSRGRGNSEGVFLPAPDKVKD